MTLEGEQLMAREAEEKGAQKRNRVGKKRRLALQHKKAGNAHMGQGGRCSDQNKTRSLQRPLLCAPDRDFFRQKIAGTSLHFGKHPHQIFTQNPDRDQLHPTQKENGHRQC
jgi:hypothetical protein